LGNQPILNPRDIPGTHVPGALLDKDLVTANDLKQIRRVGETEPDAEFVPINEEPPQLFETTPKTKGTAATIIGSIGSVLAAIAGFAAVVLLPVIFIFGATWVSVHIIDYLLIACVAAFGICILILLPLSVFRSARYVSSIGLLGSSVLFGVTTWI